MDANRLKLNDEKTEYIMFGSRHMLQRSATDQISINGIDIERSEEVKYLGAFLDAQLTLKKQITMKCRSAMNGLRLIRQIRHHLSDDACHVIVLGLVISHLDYANALYINLPSTEINKLQRIQNFAAKLITNKGKFESASSALKQLHWLPIRQRIEQKVLTLVYKSVVDRTGPKYLQSKFVRFEQDRNLRSNAKIHRLKQPKTKFKTFADRAISVAGPRLWNNLPDHIKACESIEAFKKKLKTLLFPF